MNRLWRAAVLAATMLTCIAGHAEVRRPCVTTLAAQPPVAATQKPSASTKRPCPVAIVYAPERTRREPIARATSPTDARV